MCSQPAQAECREMESRGRSQFQDEEQVNFEKEVAALSRDGGGEWGSGKYNKIQKSNKI